MTPWTVAHQASSPTHPVLPLRDLALTFVHHTLILSRLCLGLCIQQDVFVGIGPNGDSFGCTLVKLG